MKAEYNQIQRHGREGVVQKVVEERLYSRLEIHKKKKYARFVYAHSK